MSLDLVTLVPENQIIWHYIPLKYFYQLLETKTAYFKSLSKFRKDDPLEGSLYFEPIDLVSAICEQDGENRFAQKMEEFKNSTSDWEKKLIEENKDETHWINKWFTEKFCEEQFEHTHIWCWHKSLCESAAMWKLYGRCGVAIKSTIKNLQEAFNEKVDAVPVDYIPLENYHKNQYFIHSYLKQKPESIFHPYCFKSESYQFENEIRWVYKSPIKKSASVISLKNLHWIEQVSVSPYFSIKKYTSIVDTLKPYPLQINRSPLLGEDRNNADELNEVIARYGH